MTLPECRKVLNINGDSFTICNISTLEQKSVADIQRLPFSIRILLENLLRNLDGDIVNENDVVNVLNWGRHGEDSVMIPFHPARVLMQDFTGVPAVVDLAAMRDAVVDAGGDPEKINPLVPVDLVVDHSVQVDYQGSKDAPFLNVKKEYERNMERYSLLKWAQKSFDNFRVVPPGSGICHQVNLEYLAQVVTSQTRGDAKIAFPDTLVGTDSHTTMINALGVLGWGVGGIEAEAVMLGQPYFMTLPDVIGVYLEGEVAPGVTATDIVLHITHILRKENVVEKFVEFTGPGMKNLSLTDRATISNMSPEYGATMGFFPVDEKTIEYLSRTGRDNITKRVETYCRECSLFARGDESIEFTKTVRVDLSHVRSAVAGPYRPQDRIFLEDVKGTFVNEFNSNPKQQQNGATSDHYTDNCGAKADSVGEKGCSSLSIADSLNIPSVIVRDHSNEGREKTIKNGAVAIAAITSCTNTSNPNVMIGAGLVAKMACEKGLEVPFFVKTSLSPGSKVVVDYLEDAALMPFLEKLGFHTAGFGCMTCIGNSGPLLPCMDEALEKCKDLVVASVLSGNRNFEARVHQKTRANYLMSPMLVVAYALAGRVDIDFESEPLGSDSNGKPVFLADIWPSNSDIDNLVEQHVKQSFFTSQYEEVFSGDKLWKELQVTESKTFSWDKNSLYIRRPPFFEGFTMDLPPLSDINNARPLLVLGDSITTDHISPAGAIPENYPAGQYLKANGVTVESFNSYGSRRGNHEVMMRGTFGNIRIKNTLVAKQGSYTLKLPEKKQTFVFDAAMAYADEKVPLIIAGGKEYGTGSSRDWAAKGTSLLGVRAVIARSFERIHRSNLVGMGVLPLVFKQEQSFESLGLTGMETFSIIGLSGMEPGSTLTVTAEKEDGTKVEFGVISRLDNNVDISYFVNGGILSCVLRQIIA
ncbi:aconitate hydratase 1 [Desulfamplus magnetovallimortis]|uniref:Aconitate hydratase n=1 Tax=Desulfamplus magnetovallimortis TaxID=1246637 RepID=A0A1W1HKU1_9BACT|nr:aconitate hydratase AcnA [Desulfamplus magnetovallimortis]SLM33073.1 aconitate hydratase 1 [Desulfamplus magnetovallimortis]